MNKLGRRGMVAALGLQSAFIVFLLYQASLCGDGGGCGLSNWLNTWAVGGGDEYRNLGGNEYQNLGGDFDCDDVVWRFPLLNADGSEYKALPPTPATKPSPLPKITKKGVVMGMATGYRWPALRNFVVTLRHSNFAGDVVLFVSSEALLDEEMAQRFRLFNVTPVVVTERFPYFMQDSLPHSIIERHRLRPMPDLKAMNRRFYIMQIWLMTYGSLYDRVLITDTRDVFFQDDPFHWTNSSKHHPKMEDKLYAVWENSWFTIAKHDINRNWVKQAFGQNAYREIQGTTFGSTEQMLWYLRRMNRWIRRTVVDHRPRKRKETETVDNDIFDQAVHMYILYQLDWDGRLAFLENSKSPVLTLAAFVEFKRSSPPYRIMNSDMSLTPVIHQYDRYKEVVTAITNRCKKLEERLVADPTISLPSLPIDD